MKKLGFLLGLLVITGIVITTRAQSDIFEIVFHHDFQDNTLGNYSSSEWRSDWNNPAWANHDIGYGDIIDESGNKSVREAFPPGTFLLDGHGVQWEAPFDKGYDELYLSYRLKFSTGFTNTSLHGKLPGLSGGTKTPGGGNMPDGTDGISTRYMFHGTYVRFYLYHPELYLKYGDTIPIEGKNYYGESVTLDPSMNPGPETWFTLTQRIVLNTPGKHDGLAEAYINGKLAAQKTGIRWRDISSLQINKLYFSTFLGGSGEPTSYMSHIYFDDFYVYYYKDGVDVPRGHTASSSGQELILPGGEDIEYTEVPMDTVPKIKVNAYGTEYNGEYAHFKVLVNKEYIGETYVTSDEATYTFELDEQVGDNDTIYIVFDNDLFVPGEGDINLYVPSINVNNTDYYADGDNVVFVYDRDVLEGNDIDYGDDFLGYGGKLVFFLGGNVVLDDVYPILIADDIFFNDPPVMEDQTFNIVDSLIDGSLIGQIDATDDPKQKLTYEISSTDVNNTFAVIETTGEIYVNNASNLQNIDSLTLTAVATDNMCNNLSDSAQIAINIEHVDPPVVDNNPPKINSQSFDIYDNLSNGSSVGTIVATDPNITQQLSYSIKGGNSDSAFALDASNGELTVNNSSALSSTSQFTLFVEVEDNGPGTLTDNALINIEVEHVAENSQPVISDQEFDIKPGDDLNTLVMEIVATDPDAGQNLTYSIVSGNSEGIFDLNSSSGDLTVSDPSKISFSASVTHNLDVKVQDDGEGTLSSTATVDVNIIAQKTTYYIDPTNADDPQEDGTVEHPYDSWSDVTWKEGYTYLQKKGTTATEGKINIFASNVALGAYGDGDKPVINSEATDFSLRAFDKYNITIRGLKILANDAISCIYILGPACDNNVVEYCHLEGGDNGIRIIDGKTITLRYNTFQDNEDAIYSYAETNKVYYNVFNGNGTGININSYLSSTEVYNNVFYDNSKGVATSYSALTVYNNIFYLTDQGDQAINHKMDNLVSDNNIFYPEQDGFLDIADQKYSSLYEYQQTAGLDLNSFTSDPLFKDVYNDNFGVEEESPAIDAGKNVGIVMDFYGYNVPFGGAPDIGLIELVDAQGSASSVFDSEGDEDSPLIFPNPSDGYFKISFKDANFQVSELHIKDMAGNLIYRDYIDYIDSDIITEVNLTDVPKGVYLVFLAVDDKIYTQRLIIN